MTWLEREKHQIQPSGFDVSDNILNLPSLTQILPRCAGIALPKQGGPCVPHSSCPLLPFSLPELCVHA